MLSVFLNCSLCDFILLYFILRQVLSLKLALPIGLDWLLSEYQEPSVSIFPCYDHTYSWLSILGAKDLKSGLYAGVASILATELSPTPA